MSKTIKEDDRKTERIFVRETKSLRPRQSANIWKKESFRESEGKRVSVSEGVI